MLSLQHHKKIWRNRRFSESFDSQITGIVTRKIAKTENQYTFAILLNNRENWLFH